MIPDEVLQRAAAHWQPDELSVYWRRRAIEDRQYRLCNDAQRAAVIADAVLRGMDEAEAARLWAAGELEVSSR